MFENSEINKKHKGLKKGSSGMNFENYATRIVSLTNFDYFEKAPADYKKVARLTVDQGEMQKKTSLKTKFSLFNDKRFYFSDSVTSLPLFHSLLKDQMEHKKSMDQKIEKYFWDEKEVLLQKENKAQEQSKRLLLYRNILTSTPNYFPLDQKEKFVEKKQLIFKNTRDFVLERLWMGTTTKTENSKAIS